MLLRLCHTNGITARSTRVREIQVVLSSPRLTAMETRGNHNPFLHLRGVQICQPGDHATWIARQDRQSSSICNGYQSSLLPAFKRSFGQSCRSTDSAPELRALFLQLLDEKVSFTEKGLSSCRSSTRQPWAIYDFRHCCCNTVPLRISLFGLDVVCEKC